MSAAPPAPALPYLQILELIQIAAYTEPGSGSTLQTGPLRYHGLIQCINATGMPRWSVTARGRRWLAAWNAHRAHRGATVKRISPAQLAALTTMHLGRGYLGSARTREVLLALGLVDWVKAEGPLGGRTWKVTDAGRAVLAVQAGLDL